MYIHSLLVEYTLEKVVDFKERAELLRKEERVKSMIEVQIKVLNEAMRKADISFKSADREADTLMKLRRDLSAVRGKLGR